MKRLTFGGMILAYLILVLLLGGASAAGYLANLALQVTGAAIITWCWLRPSPAPSAARFPWAAFAIALLALVLIQLLPLPPTVWTSLPGRGPIAEGYRLLGEPLPWLAVSLKPWATLASLAWWIPGVALFMAMLRQDAPLPAHVVKTIVAVAVISIAIGASQRAGSQFYFYEITNYGLGTGFFANANHQASFLLATLSMWGALHLDAAAGAVRSDQRQAKIVTFWSIFLLLIAGILLSNSLAGIGLLVPVLGGLGYLAITQHRLAKRWIALSLAGIVLGLIAFAIFAWDDLTRPVSASIAGHTRLDYLKTMAKPIRDAMPFGWGIGSFREIYQWYEPAFSIGTSYVNHAHDDLAELLLETGVVILAPLGVFLAWWSRRTAALWLAQRSNPIALGATLVTGVVLAQSLVDYPLRTAAISSVFAVSCALMLRQPQPYGASPRRRTERRVGGG